MDKRILILLLICCCCLVMTAGTGIWYANTQTEGATCTPEEKSKDAHATTYTLQKDTTNKDQLTCMSKTCGEGYNIQGMPSICAVIETEEEPKPTPEEAIEEKEPPPDPRTVRTLQEQKAEAKKELDQNLVAGYEKKGKYRLLAGDSGWGYQQRIGGSTDECATFCNENEKCKGFTTKTDTSTGLNECMMYNEGQNPKAKYKSQCAIDPGSVDVCRTGVTGELYWKNQ